MVRDHTTAVWNQRSLSSIDILSLYKAIRKMPLCVCRCVCVCLCVAATASSATLPNFKSSVSTLIFSSPALRTQRKTEERDPGSICHSHPSQRFLLFSFCCSPSIFLYDVLMIHTHTHLPSLSQTHTHTHTSVHMPAV